MNLTQVQFTRIGAERKSFGILQVYSDSIYDVFPHIEKMLADNGVLYQRVGYIWNVGGTNQHYVYLDNAMKSIIAEFNLFNVSFGKETNNANQDS